ncbi:MAG: signal peptidase I, partial [Actinobacteria bacterium]|nr:signal peptidase I [Actinomycetota bacterium]
MTRPRHRRPRSALLHALRNPDRSHGHRRARRLSAAVLAYLAVAYILSARGLPALLRTAPGLDYYVAQPVLWTGLAVLAYYGWRRLPRRPPFHWTIVRAGLLVGIFHVSVLLIAGVLIGFGRSASLGRLIDYPLNVLYLGTMLVGLEMARAYLFRVWAPFVERTRLMRGGARSAFRMQALENGAFVTVTVIFFVAATPLGQFTGLADPARLFQTGAGLLVPALVLSGVATWMASVGGPGPSIAYRGTLIAFVWFSPILPDLPWVWLLLIGVITPIVAMTLFRSLAADALEEPQRHFEQARTVQKAWPGWVATIAVAAAAVALFTGVLGVRPLVVAGTSMEPALIRGDVVIVREPVDVAGLAIGDIVMYRQGTMPVTHRIVRIEDTPGGLMITTRG